MYLFTVFPTNVRGTLAVVKLKGLRKKKREPGWHMNSPREGAASLLAALMSPSICFVSYPTYHPALHITVLLPASLGAECESSWPCFLNCVWSSRKKKKKWYKHMTDFDIPLWRITFLCRPEPECFKSLVMAWQVMQQLPTSFLTHLC